MLTPKEYEKYHRQILLDPVGEAGQEKLGAASVLVAGAGGLGSPVSIYLAAAGVGEIRIVDNDAVALSNLNRQILHGEADIGRPKVDSAADTLGRINGDVRIRPVHETLTRQAALSLARGCAVIVDALDNLSTRTVLNRTAVDLGIPLVHGAVNGFDGRALTVVPGVSACLRCMHRDAAEPDTPFPVMGVAPAVIGAIQATEAIKSILGIGEILAGRLLIYDGLAMTFSEFRVKRNPECDHCGHI